LISALAIVPDVGRTVSMDLKSPGNVLFLVGLTRAELGASAYFRELGLEGGGVPAPDLERAPALLGDLHRAMAAGLVHACHDLSEGGLAVAAGEMAFAGDRGLDLDLGAVPLEIPPGADPDAAALFSESCTRFLVEVAPEDEGAFARALEGRPLAPVGRVREDDLLRIRSRSGQPLVELPLERLRAAHQSSFQG